VPQLDLLDEVFVAAAPALVREYCERPATRARLWPGLTVTVAQERGDEGQRYAVVAGGWHGTAEIWLERCADGVLLHTYLRIDPAGPVPPRRVAAEGRRRRGHGKRELWRIKDEIEAGRAAGEPARQPPPQRPQQRGR
jgi:hypothetical protein